MYIYMKNIYSYPRIFYPNIYLYMKYQLLTVTFVLTEYSAI